MWLPYLLFLGFSARPAFAVTDPCSGFVSSAVSLGSISGKCVAVAATCDIGVGGANFYEASIDSDEENALVTQALKKSNIEKVKLGYISNDGKNWQWSNNDTSKYSNWKNDAGPTTLSPRSTVPPSQQRRSTAIVIGIDASIFATASQILAQIDFAKSLVDHISARGPSEFAIFAYGCSQITPWTDQYPYFVPTYSNTIQMIQSLKTQLLDSCVRSNPLDFRSMFMNQQILYYNRQMFSPRPFKSKFISMIFFSASTNSTNIQSTSTLFQIPDSSIITVNIGSKSSNIKRLSIPSTSSNWFQVTSSDDILGLVPKIDAAIFRPSGASGSAADEVQAFSGLSAVPDYCAYLDSTDGFWYYDASSCPPGLSKTLCQFRIPAENSRITEPGDPCPQEYKYRSFVSLNNAKCYQISPDKQSFSDAENECTSEHAFLHASKLTSIQSYQESNMVDTMLDGIEDEGMFWIGLRRSDEDREKWIFINDDPYNASEFNNWKEGYPRDVDGYDCAAYVVIDKKWINIDCEKKLYSVCSHQFNSTNVG